MAREILISVKEDGTVEILTRGYVGRACVDEVERLVMRLRELGVEVETRELTPLTEYFQAGTEVRSGVRAGAGRSET
jgi:hypothetical protein